MKVSIHQPMYLPWLGLFDRINQSDIFVLLDNVAYSKNYYINRNKIKTKNGCIWLTVPVLSKGSFGQLINEVRVNNSLKWQEQHWKSMYYSYKDAKYFLNYSDFFEKFYSNRQEYLFDIINESFEFLLKSLKIKAKIVKSSMLKAKGKKEELILNICKELGADEYLSGPSGNDYLNADLWKQNNIKLEFHNFSHPTYNQLYKGFCENMSVIDLLFNHGEESLKIISNQR